jgi:hypothetical protein
MEETPWLRTTPTEREPHVGEVSANLLDYIFLVISGEESVAHSKSPKKAVLRSE